MKIEIKYELPIFSSSLKQDPVIRSKDLNMEIELIGMDEESRSRKITIKFNSVLCNKHTSARFTPKLYDSYDKIVELVDSEWLAELKNVNKEYFDYWNPKHYILYLDGAGMFQFIAQGYEVSESDPDAGNRIM